jgi:retinol dehydrogenase-12
LIPSTYFISIILARFKNLLTFAYPFHRTQTRMPFKQSFSEFFPPQPSFTENDIPSLVGKTYLITGGAAGVGKELCRMLYSAGATIFVAGRSLTNIEEAIKDIKDNPIGVANAGTKAPAGTIIPMILDLADLPSIKPAVEKLKLDASKIDVAFLNAGVMSPPAGSKTKQGYEQQWGTNVVGHFVLQKLLLPLLLATAQEKGEARVIWVSSDASKSSPSPDGIYWDNINDQNLRSMRLYAQSKAGNVILASETAARYGQDNIVSVSLNPGHLRTALQRHWNPYLVSIINATLTYEPRYGALTELFAGFSEQLGTQNNGKYLIPWGREGKMAKQIEKGLENGSGSRLWNLLEIETEQYV